MSLKSDRQQTKTRIRATFTGQFNGEQFETGKTKLVDWETGRFLVQHRLAEDVANGKARNSRAGEGVCRSK